jgi:hypothetical protein
LIEIAILGDDPVHLSGDHPFEHFRSCVRVASLSCLAAGTASFRPGRRHPGEGIPDKLDDPLSVEGLFR